MSSHYKNKVIIKPGDFRLASLALIVVLFICSTAWSATTASIKIGVGTGVQSGHSTAVTKTCIASTGPNGAVIVGVGCSRIALQNASGAGADDIVRFDIQEGAKTVASYLHYVQYNGTYLDWSTTHVNYTLPIPVKVGPNQAIKLSLSTQNAMELWYILSPVIYYYDL
jgi:hypothetical protein